MQPTAWPRCLYTNVCSMGNKPKEGLEATMLKLGPCCHYWNLVAQIVWLKCDYQWLWAVQKRQKWGRCGGIALYIKRCSECEELFLKNSHEQVPRLGKNQTRRQQKELCGWSLLQLPDQGEPIDKAFLPHLRGASCSHAPVLLEGLQPPSYVLRKANNTKANCRQPRRLLQCKDSFVSQVIALPEGTQYWIWWSPV